MSETGRKDLAYPKSQVEAPKLYMFQLCGGSGAGGCATPLGATKYVYSIRVPKHVVFNRSLLLRNKEGAVDIYSDAGFDGICSHSAGTRQPWYLAFSADGNLTDAQIIAQGNVFNQAPPFDIEILANKLPQPVLAGGGANPLWQNRIYVHIYWGNATFVWPDSPFHSAGQTMYDDVLEVVKHNYDIKI